MALVQAGRQLLLPIQFRQGVHCISSKAFLFQSVKIQHGFTGLEGCFVWDDKNGFGYTKTGEVVIVTPNSSAGPDNLSNLNIAEDDLSTQSTPPASLPQTPGVFVDVETPSPVQNNVVVSKKRYKIT